MGTPIGIELTSELKQYILEYRTENELLILENRILALQKEAVKLVRL